ncbi:MAG: Vi polysaccharide biosynthesis protein VipA/TviB [Candidatus Marinimicrobia bacterium]|nr:Vi polysaccharide biosynthesis protein VipA/TviB [Candidatus Neomarinimicrobiota bacterium]
MNIRPCVIGLGYVGLPVLLNLSKKFQTFGFDVNKKRILDLKKNIDSTKEYRQNDLKILKSARLTYNLNDIKKSNFYIICVPTPVNIKKKPDLNPLISACKMVAKVLNKGDIVIFESTVYPGTTQGICVPVIERISGFKYGKNDFFVCYSPERVNPGDNKHTLKKIDKIIAIPNSSNVNKVKKVYKNLSKKLIISNNLEETETSKVIENIQRDINIALMNEIYIFCDKLKINFENVHKLASTKWNFTNYSPGLVGGHCLPVDPYYFSHIAEQNKIQTRVTLAGRSINEYMRKFLIKKIKNFLKDKKINYKKDIIIFAGLTYKKNVSDMRNSQSFKIFDYFRKFNRNTHGLDPFLEKNLKEKIINYKDSKKLEASKCIILLVEHKKLNFLSKKSNLKKKLYNVFKINQGKTYQ